MVLRLEGKSSTLQRSSKVGPDFGHENHGPHFVVHTRMCVCVCVCVCTAGTMCHVGVCAAGTMSYVAVCAAGTMLMSDVAVYMQLVPWLNQSP